MERRQVKKLYPRERNMAYATREVLVSLFPEAFRPKGAIKVPLKLGIHLDLLTRTDLAFWRVRCALIDYTSGYKYLTQIVEGAPRIDLDGNPAGAVTAKEAAHARELLEARGQS
jgi:ProP effector